MSQQCFLCLNSEHEEIKKISTFVNEQISSISIECICKQIADHLRESNIADLQVENVYEHVTKHMSNRRIDTYVGLQDLKAVSQTVKNLTHKADEATGTVIVDSKLLAIYLDTVKQVVALHKSV